LRSPKRKLGKIFNIGSGEETYFNRLVAAIRHFLKSNSKVVNKPWREGEKGLRVCLDIAKARGQLGYDPMINLLDGIRNTALYIASDALGWDEKALDDLRQNTFGIYHLGVRG
jgi:nucleoside-diphosphate-sugar epimerase